MNTLEQALGRYCPQQYASLPRSARLAFGLLDQLEHGALAISLPNGESMRVGHGPLVAHLSLRAFDALDRALATGDIGLAEAWMDGEWDTDDLPAVLALLSRNRETLGRAVYGRSLALVGHRLWHLFRANTRSGSRRNIEAHYDLGNDFYQLWLDPSMTYSAAVFESRSESLEVAQLRKYRRILDRLGAKPGQTILEVGCGWGGFAEVACLEYGCTVLGITLSPSQLDFARQRAENAGFADKVRLELCDYRDVRGHYDHVVSIEMIEAVGERFWPVYFAQLSALLRPGGRCVVQAITIRDELFGAYRRGTDFIQRYVFPGGMLPSASEVNRHANKAGLRLDGDFAFGADYASTLALWHQEFQTRGTAISALGYPERFMRMWRFYLAYCEAGFRTGDIDVHHYEFVHARPSSDGL